MHFINEIPLDGQNAATNSQHWKISILGAKFMSFITWLQKPVGTVFHGFIFVST